MFTTELSHRIFLTVLLLSIGRPIGVESGESGETSTSFSKPIRLRTPSDLSDLPNFPSGPNGTFSTTRTISTSFSMKKGEDVDLEERSKGAGSVFIDTKPISLFVTDASNESNFYTKKFSESKMSNKKGEQEALSNFQCNGPNCPRPIDETYYSFLNGRYGENPTWRNNYWQSPFDHFYSFSSPTGKRGPMSRMSRTSVNSPSWVKLLPFYDPFSLVGPKDDPYDSDDEPQSQFANRLGEELSPESFADRYGWNEGSSQKGGGSRLPAWLEEQYKQKGGSYHSQRPPFLDGEPPHLSRPSSNSHKDDAKNWVKLEPIPVAGVSISKWVPKGTSNSDLPSTNWPVRDRPNAWWDRDDYSNKRPTFSLFESWVNKGGSDSSRFPSTASGQKRPDSSGWNDIIYPDTPLSATASWDTNKGIPFPVVPQQWDRDRDRDRDYHNGVRRPPNNVASWTAPGSSPSRFGNRRPSVGNPSFYPNRDKDDPRWVLVSNTRRVSLSPGHSGGHGPHSSGHGPHSGGHGPSNYQGSNRFHHGHGDLESPFEPYPYHPNYGHRVGKKKKWEQDETFEKVNATLNSLTPVLNHRKGIIKGALELNSRPPIIHKTDRILKEKGYDSEGHPIKVDSKEYDEIYGPEARMTVDEHISKKKENIKSVNVGEDARRFSSAMAALLPKLFGRRRRDISDDSRTNYEMKPVKLTRTSLSRAISPQWIPYKANSHIDKLRRKRSRSE